MPKTNCARGVANGLAAILLFSGILISTSLAVADQNSDKELKQRLLNTLIKFSEENGITIVETVNLLRSQFTFIEEQPKGGVGLIGDEIYILTDSSEGNVILQGKKRIKLGGSERISMVSVQGGNIIDKVEVKADPSKGDALPLKTIIFSKKDIYVLDWDSLTGRYFRRR